MSPQDPQPLSIQDLFISHAVPDKERYINPLTRALVRREVSFWLDTLEIAWGDSITGKINEGLRGSRYLLVCLSSNFLERRWSEDEMNSALAAQNSNGVKRVLPLILNSRDDVLAAYPLLADKAYRMYDNPETIAGELADLVSSPPPAASSLRLVVESVHTGRLCNLRVSPRVSIAWLIDKAMRGMNLRTEAELGEFVEFAVRWVLVDTAAENEWHQTRRSDQRRMRAIVKTKDGIRISRNDVDRIEDLGVTNNKVFHMYAIENEDERPPRAYMVQF